MCLKNKIVAAALCALIAGVGIFGTGANIAQAQGSNSLSGLSIAQLQQLVSSLTRQIQQVIQQIAYWKPLETCGNGICRFGETAASCPADCKETTCTSALTGAACKNAGGQEICGTVCSDPGGCKSAGCSCDCVKTPVCSNGTCDNGETATGCPADCNNSISCAKEGQTFIDTNKQCCPGLSKSGPIPSLSPASIPTYTCQNLTGAEICTPTSTRGCQVCDSNGSWKDTDSKCGTGKTCAQGQCLACAAAGEKFHEFDRSCCAGLQKKEIVPVSSCGTDLFSACVVAQTWTCEKPTATCYNEGQGVIGYSTEGAISCCTGLTAKARTVCTGSMCSTQEGFICSK